MNKVLLGIAALTLAACAFAQNSVGIAYGEGRGRTIRDTQFVTKFWLASTEAGIYGTFRYAEAWERNPRADVEIFMNCFDAFLCEGMSVFFAGRGYVNGTPRVILVQAQDGVWYPDLFAIAAFHPISGTLLYDRWGVFTRGGVSVLCELPNGGE
ncbi:MAG: hypothetical protein HRF45_13875 [Fimbriimonadia bacterium]|jgi:hypothetical protein